MRVRVSEGWGLGTWPLPTPIPPVRGPTYLTAASQPQLPAPPSCCTSPTACRQLRQSAQAQLVRGLGAGSPAARPVCPPCPRPFLSLPGLSLSGRYALKDWGLPPED